MQPLSFTHQDLIAIERELSRRSLAEFVKLSWHIIEPSQPYIHNWHIDCVCAHLEAVTRGELTRLLINIPPGTMKSLLVNVFWPAWEWGAQNRPNLRYVTASHGQEYAIRDNMRMRRLVESEWFQQRWPVTLAKDQNEKTKFENSFMGFRQAMAVKSMTGSRGDRVIWDDPHNVEGALSDAERGATIRIFSETLPTRLNNPDKSAIVIVMQRLHEDDVSGFIIENDLGYVHLCLPMEFEPERACNTRWYPDPRKEEGELLFPQRFSREVVERDKKVMGSVAVAGQFQQRPTPRGGGMFKADMLTIVDHAPLCARFVRYWDKAGTDGGGAYTAGVKMGVTTDGKFVVVDVQRGQWSALERERRIKQTADVDGVGVDVWIEQEPGSGGKESAENTVRNLAGYNVRLERVTGDKATRASPYSAQIEAGNVWLIKAQWTRDFINEHETFPNGKYKDQVDASAGAFNKLAVVSAQPRVRAL